MKNYFKLAIVGLLLTACQTSRNSHSTDTKNSKTDLPKSLYAHLQIKDTLRSGTPVELTFTVHNPADSALQFCKWHTPFEPLISKYLSIKSEQGEEAAYLGPMAKRVMPPPAESYLSVDAKDSLTATIDLLDGYEITQPGTYTLVYTGENISGVSVRDSVSFVYLE